MFGTGAGQKLVLSTMKNEGPFVLEWVAHHRAIGFDGFVIFSNDCTDGTDRILDRLDDAAAELDVALARMPYAPRTLLEWARVAHAMGDTAAAIEALEMALDTWAEADAGYAPAAEARVFLEELTAN